MSAGSVTHMGGFRQRGGSISLKSHLKQPGCQSADNLEGLISPRGGSRVPEQIPEHHGDERDVVLGPHPRAVLGSEACGPVSLIREGRERKGWL